MRSYRGARQLTGRANPRGMLTDETFFSANFDGTCRGCGMRYRVGDKIKSPGKGRGAYHVACKMFEKEPENQPEIEELRDQTRSAIAHWNR